MKQLCWTGKAFKQLSVSAKYKTAGRNSSGSITMFHRGGGSTRLWRRIDFKRNVLMSGFVERIEYDPNRSARIALVRSNFEPNDGEIVSTVFPEVHNTAVNLWQHDKFYQQIGNCIPLRNIPIGTVLHNIELHPGQGGKVVRAAGTFAQLVQKLPLEAPRVCLVRLPSGLNKQFDSRCRATIGIVSNPAHNTRKLTKAGQRRWLGKRPIVRGVAMNPVDHPHGGGEGRTKGGRPSVSPWGKPTKGGFKTRKRKQHN
uniref:Large ribosomal subunit protein uL2m n=1 Tax=Zygnema circumcarinatum TaxID=35869 RepID=A0A6N0GXQ2_ZYGCR|nr:ribosomal protein L2 [Zygnema circumcarinatum]